MTLGGRPEETSGRGRVRYRGLTRFETAWRLVLGAAAVLALAVFAGRTLDQVGATVSSSGRTGAADVRGVYLCLSAELRTLPSDETYWIGPATADGAREIWRQRLVQRSFPHLDLADSVDEATVVLGLEATQDGDGCGSYHIVATPGPRRS